MTQERFTVDSRAKTLIRAHEVYGDALRVSRRQYTVDTLQGVRETGYIVYGRAYGGDFVGCVYPRRSDALAVVDHVQADME
jgi:hypothetical protein